MTRDFSVGKMIISPSVPLPSFALSDPKDMHAQLEARDKSARLEKKQETSLDTYNADDIQNAPRITCVSRYLSLETLVSRNFKLQLRKEVMIIVFDVFGQKEMNMIPIRLIPVASYRRQIVPES
jgi:hypothetical protein